MDMFAFVAIEHATENAVWFTLNKHGEPSFLWSLGIERCNNRHFTAGITEAL